MIDELLLYYIITIMAKTLRNLSIKEEYQWLFVLSFVNFCVRKR